ncbi:hypothetical protein PF007_g16322 [Phytophthora fragariae]|uniref:DDE Tnp4 domain-containing protein n=1 Tax=Phytophthora fragariae TaxID=53985 RepID=A0A6A3RIW2_9STRA|nr:hypothetical protein PF007_g16322 [Phytophthora fragariae]
MAEYDVTMTEEDAENDEFDALLCLAEVFVSYEKDLREVRGEVFRLLMEDAWRIAMKSRHYLTAQSLDPPSNSAWMSLYKAGNGINFINATSLTRPAFHQLLKRFSSFYDIPGAGARGRPPKLRHHHQVLGLVLCFYVGSMENSTLCMVFGVPPSTLSRTLRRAEDALSQTLQGYPPSRISFPSPAQQVKLARLVEARESLLKNTFGSIDGKNLRR